MLRNGVWSEDKQMHAAHFSVGSNSKISSFTPSQCFQAADAQNITQKCSPAWANRFTMGLPGKPTSATTDTFICPDNGIIVIDAYKDTNSGTIHVYVNGVMMFAAPAYNATGFAICFPVTRGDSIKLATDQTAAGWTVRRDDFVPYIGGY